MTIALIEVAKINMQLLNNQTETLFVLFFFKKMLFFSEEASIYIEKGDGDETLPRNREQNSLKLKRGSLVFSSSKKEKTKRNLFH